MEQELLEKMLRELKDITSNTSNYGFYYSELCNINTKLHKLVELMGEQVSLSKKIIDRFEKIDIQA